MRLYGYKYYTRPDSIIKFLNTNPEINVTSITYNSDKKGYDIFYYEQC
jgi:hypothetical protein